jgi:acyl-CoA dehydrogenase
MRGGGKDGKGGNRSRMTGVTACTVGETGDREPIAAMSQLTKQQQQFDDTLAKAIADISPVSRVQELDAAKQFDMDLHGAMSRLGVMGLGVEPADGGSGGGSIEQMIALRSLGNRATSMAVFSVVQFLVTRVLKNNANENQRRQFLVPLATGKSQASFCMTEAGGGTDILRAMKTTATRDGDAYLLDGTKMWVSGAATSDFYVVLARTSVRKTDGISTFLVPSATAGVSHRKINTFAIHGYDVCEVVLDNVRVPIANLVGEEGRGFRQVLSCLNAERLSGAAVALGMAQGAMETAAHYARERAAFGKTLSQLQAVQHKLANVATAIELAWTFLLTTARLEEAGGQIDVASAMAKLSASNAAKLATDAGMEIMGAAGFDTRCPMQRYYRDHRLYSFAPLNDEMCRNLIAERYFGFGRSF